MESRIFVSFAGRHYEAYVNLRASKSNTDGSGKAQGSMAAWQPTIELPPRDYSSSGRLTEEE